PLPLRLAGQRLVDRRARAAGQLVDALFRDAHLGGEPNRISLVAGDVADQPQPVNGRLLQLAFTLMYELTHERSVSYIGVVLQTPSGWIPGSSLWPTTNAVPPAGCGPRAARRGLRALGRAVAHARLHATAGLLPQAWLQLVAPAQAARRATRRLE